jgi:hypothetical protein
MKMTVFWDAAQYGLVEFYRRFRGSCCHHHQGDEYEAQQPTKKLTKGGVLHKLQTSSLARFTHSCVRNALLEMVRGALKL